MHELDIARQAARAGGEVVTRYFHQGVNMRAKGVSDLVSDADVESERAIAACLQQAFPEHAILGEELHHDQVEAEHVWIVDPLDGTTNFAHQIPHFAVSIAYYYQGQPRCGVIWNPIRDEWYTAVAGRGAWKDDRAVQVSSSTQLSQELIGVGFYYDRGRMMQATLAALAELFGRQIHGIRRFGTASLDLCQVGCGWFGGFFEYELSPWDFAAGALFVTEAGGRISTCRGEALPQAKSSVLASNGLLHEELLGVVRAHCLD